MGKEVGHARKEEGPNTNFFIKLKAFTSYARVTFHKSTKFNSPEVAGSDFSLKIHYFLQISSSKLGKSMQLPRTQGSSLVRKLRSLNRFLMESK